MRFRIHHFDVEYNGIYIPIPTLKKYIKQTDRDISAHELIGARHFNKEDGEIERKYAWDAVIQEMIDDKSLLKVIQTILRTEYE